jgi:glutathione peroxidase-family protein
VIVKKFLSISLLLFSAAVHGQLADGSVAPDFTLTDYFGTEHNLYEYLNEGKTVFVEIFAAHCPSCWNYHETDRLKNIYIDYGPDGTDELMVLALECDQWNTHDDFKGIGDP